MSKDHIQKAVCQAIKTMRRGKAIKRVQLFGSHLHGNASPNSDIDLLVDLDDNAQISLFDLIDIQDAFAETLGKEVDIGTPNELSKYIRSKVLAEAETLYER